MNIFLSAQQLGSGRVFQVGPMSPLPMVQLFNRSVFGASGEETNLIIMIEIIINNNYCADYHKSQHYDDHEKFWLKICGNGVLVTT